MLQGRKITVPCSKSEAERVKKEAPSTTTSGRGKQSCRWPWPNRPRGYHVCISHIACRMSRLNTLDSNGALAVQLVRIPVVALLLAVLQSLALVILEHAMTAAVPALAEAAVTNNGLCAVLAILEGTTDLLWGHAAAERECEVESRVGADGVISQAGVG